MLKEEVVAQDGSAESPALHPHTAGSRARPNFVSPPEAICDCLGSVVRALARRLR